MAEEEEKRKQFGNRFLTDEANVFEHNAWDNVPWDEEMIATATVKIEENSAQKLPEEKREELEKDAPLNWDHFYGQHQNRFFKDRHWLFTEIPELTQQNRESRFVILEVGCGVGNSVYPIVEVNQGNNLFVYCCDFSQKAIDILKEHKDYNADRVGAFTADVTDPECSFPFPEGSLDIILMIFVLSAISPDKMQICADRLAKLLKPGGMLFFRDYGRYDLAQLRFKKGRCIAENFYARSDGTRSYFFTQDEVEKLFSKAGLVCQSSYVDKRLQVNRGKQLKMYRVWIQCKFERPK